MQLCTASRDGRISISLMACTGVSILCAVQRVFPQRYLVRAIEPDEGLDLIEINRPGIKPADWCSGPARLCKALGIDGDLNGVYLCESDSPLFIEDAFLVEETDVTVSPRVGIQYAPEPWRSLPWRFTLDRNWRKRIDG